MMAFSFAFIFPAKGWMENTMQVPDLMWDTEESLQGKGTMRLARVQAHSAEANISISQLTAL